jgi:hypothetical protein
VESRAIESSCERDCAEQCSVICPSAANADVLLRHYVHCKTSQPRDTSAILVVAPGQV